MAKDERNLLEILGVNLDDEGFLKMFVAGMIVGASVGQVSVDRELMVLSYATGKEVYYEKIKERVKERMNKFIPGLEKNPFTAEQGQALCDFTFQNEAVFLNII